LDGATSNDREDETAYRVQSDEAVTEAVVRAVTAERRSGRTRSESASDNVEMEPLYSVIDTEALNELFAPLESEVAQSRQTNGTVTFRYGGFHVRVTSDGTVGVRPTGPE
jgi:hypothetical protein